MPVCPAYYNCSLHITGQHSCDCRTSHTQSREEKHTIDQQVIKQQIHTDCHNSCFHWKNSLSALSQSTGINLYHHKRRQSQQHNIQILFSIIQRICNLLRSTLSLKIHTDQILSNSQKQQNRPDCQDHSHPELIPECLPHTLMILLPKVLCRKNTRSGHPSENTQIIDKNQLIHNGSPRHLLRTDPPDHNIIQQTHEIRDSILDHDRNSHSQNHHIKLPVTDKLLTKR